MELFFASHNQNKLIELRKIIPEFITVKDLNDLGLSEEIVENGDTIEANSAIKANYVYQRYNVACFADDTGLEVEALNGEPGVYSARYAGPQKNSDDNMNLLMSKLSPFENRAAQFKTVITLKQSHEEPLQFEGIVKGRIIDHKRGTEGFGYDPIFVPEGYKNTFAEMTLTEKNKISHRARAFQKLISYLEKLKEK